MERAFPRGMQKGAVAIAALLLFPPARASEGLESGAPGLESPPAAQDVKTPLSPKPMKPLLRVRKALLRGVARAIQPFFNYSRHHLVLLLPSVRHLPPNLAPRPHDDYMIPGLALIPRGWNTFDWGHPDLIIGNQKNFQDGSPKPIGERGSFQLSSYPQLPVPFCWVPIYFAFTLPNGVHFRLGARWDDVDAYVVAPSIAIKTDVDSPATPPASVALQRDDK